MRWLALALLLASQPTQAGTVLTDVDGYIVFKGEIVTGDAVKLRAALARTKPANGRIVLMLDSEGGDYDEGVKMSDAVLSYRRRVTVRAAVPWSWQCSSSCITIFAAASEREIGRKGVDKDGTYWHAATLRVHSVVSVVNGREVLDRSALGATWAWTRILRVLDVPPQVIDKVASVSSRKGEPLTEDDLKAWGVMYRDP